MPRKALLTTKDVAAMNGVKPQAVRDARKKGRIKPWRLTLGGRPLYREEDALLVPPETAPQLR